MNSNTSEPVPVPEISPRKVLPLDTLAEVGRKVVLTKVDKIHQSETAENKPDVYNMQTAMLQVQGALNLLKPHFKSKTMRRYKQALHHRSQVLSDIQNVDMLIEELHLFEATLDSDNQVILQGMLEKLVQQQAASQEALKQVSSSKAQRRFAKSLTALANEPIADGKSKLSQVRHLLPSLIYDRLAIISAYDELLEAGDITDLQKLNLELKRLLYTVSPFEDVLGKQIADFTKEVQSIQDTLDEIKSTAKAQSNLDCLVNTSKKKYAAISEAYLQYCEAKKKALIAELQEKWSRFNSRKVQQKLSTALLALYEN